MPHELTLTRELAASRHDLFRCWTEPDLMKQWFCPLPWKLAEVKLDVRAGGANEFLMRGPNGEEHADAGVYLELVRDEKIVFTDAFTKAWEPSGKAFMVGTVTFRDAPGGGTLYTATVAHWNAEDRDAHEKMGFHEGWGKATDQLEALAKTLS